MRTGRAIINHSVTSKDGTRKFLLQLSDGRLVETVGIPVDKDAAEGSGRLTVCVSSQVGLEAEHQPREGRFNHEICYFMWHAINSFKNHWSVGADSGTARQPANSDFSLFLWGCGLLECE